MIKTISCFALLTTCALPSFCFADEQSWRETVAADLATIENRLPVGKDYVLGINRFNLDAHTEMLGWQLSKQWYLGRQDGLDSGLTLVWQQKANQVSVSKDGLRLTRRF